MASMLAGTSLVMLDPAAIMANRPMRTGAISMTPEPTYA
jgi:hypothetical protein